MGSTQYNNLIAENFSSGHHLGLGSSQGQRSIKTGGKSRDAHQ